MQSAEQPANKNMDRWWSHIKRMAPTAPQSKGHEIAGKIMYPDGTRRWESR